MARAYSPTSSTSSSRVSFVFPKSGTKAITIPSSGPRDNLSSGRLRLKTKIFILIQEIVLWLISFIWTIVISIRKFCNLLCSTVSRVSYLNCACPWHQVHACKIIGCIFFPKIGNDEVSRIPLFDSCVGQDILINKEFCVSV